MENNAELFEKLHQKHTRAVDIKKVKRLKRKFILQKLRHEMPWTIILTAAGIVIGALSVALCGIK